MEFQSYRKYSDTFIETGTYIGESVAAALRAGFINVRSVELHPRHFAYSTARFIDNNNVKIFNGKSVDMLPEMIKDIPIPSVFWLDAHPSGPTTALHNELMAGDIEANQDTILTKELKIILEHGRHVILIDDQQGMKTGRMFADMIDNYYPGTYEFSIVDEVWENYTNKDKVLVCLPVL